MESWVQYERIRGEDRGDKYLASFLSRWPWEAKRESFPAYISSKDVLPHLYKRNTRSCSHELQNFGSMLQSSLCRFNKALGFWECWTGRGVRRISDLQEWQGRAESPGRCLQALLPENEGWTHHGHHLHGSWGECQPALQWKTKGRQNSLLQFYSLSFQNGCV